MEGIAPGVLIPLLLEERLKVSLRAATKSSSCSIESFKDHWLVSCFMTGSLARLGLSPFDLM
jgi:hypothetical protein